VVIEAVTYEAHEPDSLSGRTSLPWRASARCPITGELVLAAGTNASAALYSLGRAMVHRVRKLTNNTLKGATIEL